MTSDRSFHSRRFDPFKFDWKEFSSDAFSIHFSHRIIHTFTSEFGVFRVFSDDFWIQTCSRPQKIRTWEGNWFRCLFDCKQWERFAGKLTKLIQFNGFLFGLRSRLSVWFLRAHKKFASQYFLRQFVYQLHAPILFMIGR